MTARSPRVLQITVDLLRGQWWIAAIAWSAMYLLFGGIGAIVAVSSDLTSSVWIGAGWWSQYLLLSAGIMVASSHLRVYVGHGVTRRVFALGTVMYGLIASTLFGMLMELGFVIEHRVAAAFGWQPPGAEGFTGSAAHIAASTAEFTLLHAAYFFGGWTIATAFHRFGVVRGLLVIVPVLLPALLMDVVKLGEQPATGLLAALGADVNRMTLTGLAATGIAVVVIACLGMQRTVPVNAR